MPAPERVPGATWTCPSPDCRQKITVKDDLKEYGHKDGCSIAHNLERDRRPPR